jgi:hypothetical protein
MMSLAPYLPPATGDTTAALLQVLSNPAEAKKMLEKMAQERKAIDAAMVKQQEAFAQNEAALRKARSEIEKIKNETDRLAAKSEADLGAAQTALAHAVREREQSERSEHAAAELRALTDQRESILDAQEKDLAKNVEGFHEAEHRQRKWEESLTKREADLAMREKTLAEDIAEHSKWLASLRPPRGR